MMAFNINPVVSMERPSPTHGSYYLYSYQRLLHKGWRYKTPLKQARNTMKTAHTIGVRAQFDASLPACLTVFVQPIKSHRAKVMAVASHLILT